MTENHSNSQWNYIIYGSKILTDENKKHPTVTFPVCNYKCTKNPTNQASKMLRPYQAVYKEYICFKHLTLEKGFWQLTFEKRSILTLRVPAEVSFLSNWGVFWLKWATLSYLYQNDNCVVVKHVQDRVIKHAHGMAFAEQSYQTHPWNGFWCKKGEKK